MRILAYPADRGGCGYYRVIWPAEAAADNGLEITIADTVHIPIVYDHRWPGHGDPPLGVGIVALAEPPNADLVILQRPTHWSRARLIQLLQQAGIAVVVDIDDDIHSLPAGHPGRPEWSPARHPDRNKMWLTECCARADLVTVTTPALAERYAPHGRVAILPNCVPAWYLDVEPARNDPPVITWTGTPATHVGDLSACGTAVADTMAATGARFRAIGSARTLVDLGVNGVVTGWADLTDRRPRGYPRTIAACDIALAPLLDSPFCRAKSCLKGLEAAALGVPFVASPTPDYRRLHAAGAGLLADTVDDWRTHLNSLASDPARRYAYSEIGRAAVATMTYEHQWPAWAQAWQQAVTNRRQDRTAA